VFVIVMENHSYGRALSGRYTSHLAAEYPTATDYHAVGFPSLPNYLALTSGSTWGITDDGYHRLPAGGLGAQLTGAGIEWRAYMEGMSRGCFNSPYPYALKHNPFAYYGGTCPDQVVPFTNFAADMKGNVPKFVWITPGLCHDGHDCPTEVADQWLSQTVPLILATPAWQENGLLLITWDEGDDKANHVLTLAIHPHPAERVSSVAYDHYSLLATIQDRLGVPRLGRAAFASPMTDMLASTLTQ
jgi:acid phosphatase